MRESQFRILSIIICLFVLAPTSLYAVDCEKIVGTLEALRGVAELKQKELDVWISIKTGAEFCPGDSLHIDKNSTAAIRFDEETLIRLDGGSTLTFPVTKTEETSWLDLLHGTIYLLTRDPHGLEVTTPFLRAGVDGTEFFVQTKGDKATTWVYEGRIHAINPYGDLILSEGDAASSGGNSAPQALKIKPVNAVQWALFYPAIIDQNLADYGLLASDHSFQRTISSYRKGRLYEAINDIKNVPEDLHNADYFNVLAGLQLSAGHLKEARSAIQSSLNSKSKNGVALALQSIMATTQNDKKMALNLAQLATNLEPESPVTHIALSYAYQTHFQIKEALNSALQATNHANDNALAWSRVSELYLMQGETDQSFSAANHAVELNPDLSRTQSTLGFAYLSQYKFDRAREAFNNAIQLDQVDPQPRLGTGLISIRKGQLKQGRKDLELAVILDPLNALYRSYLGKAYYEEKRSKLAGKQYELSKQLDPNDPTPWLYDALLNQSENAPGKALKNWQQSINLNDNRAVYRSRLLLEEDKAIRAAGLGRTYRNLGFDQLGKQEGLRSQREDPDSYVSHKLLADIFQGQAGFDLATVSEAHQAELRQPLTPVALRPQITSAQLPILEGSGPPDPGYNEYNNLFSRDRVAFKINGVVGGNGTHSEDMSFGILSGQNAIHLSRFNYETDGIKINQDLKLALHSLVFQHQLNSRTRLRFEASKGRVDEGDVSQRITNRTDQDYRLKNDNNIFKFGLHSKLSPKSSLLLSLKYLDNDEFVSDKAIFPSILPGIIPDSILSLTKNTQSTSHLLEAQHLYKSLSFSIINGISYVDRDADSLFKAAFLPQPPFVQPYIDQSNNRSKLISLYSYFTQQFLNNNLYATLAVSYDHLSENTFHSSKVHPKFAIFWQATPTTDIRFSIFRSIQKQYLTQAILESTNIGGYPQQINQVNGGELEHIGLSVEQEFLFNIFAGLSLQAQRIDKEGKRIQNEKKMLAYLYWLPQENLSLRLDTNFADFNREITSREDPCGIKETYSSLEINYYPAARLHTRVKVDYVHQKNKISATTIDVTCSKTSIKDLGDDFWTLDAEINYIFPKRWGSFGLLVKNIGNQNFLYQDRNFISSSNEFLTKQLDKIQPSQFTYIPERIFFMRYSVNF